jgi:hypothetical protein
VGSFYCARRGLSSLKKKNEKIEERYKMNGGRNERKSLE